MTRKKLPIGYIYLKGDHYINDTLLIKHLGERMDVVPIVLEKQHDLAAIAEAVKDCRLVVNYAAAEPVTFEAMELTKTFEAMGKKVVNSSRSFYYNEDKWIFYQQCVENDLPTPVTYLIPREGHDEAVIRGYLARSPLVLKAIFSDKGLAVEKADCYEDFIEKLGKIDLKNHVSPIIAQELIPNPKHLSARITLVGGIIVQAVLKKGKTWKQTGIKDSETYRRFEVDEPLRKMAEKAARVLHMELCGLDLIQKEDSSWTILEANSCPGLGFITCDRARLMGCVADYLHELAKALHRD